VKRVRCWVEVYEHAKYGVINLCWHGEEPDRSRLIALQSDLWTPAEEIADCLEWARNLQVTLVTRGGDAGAPQD